MNKFNPIFSLAGRAMIALIFVLSGLSKIFAIEDTQGVMEAMGVPGILIYAAILFEVGAGLAIIAGFQTRIVALLPAGFTLFTAFMFHNPLGDQMQFIMFMKNVAIAGGLLFLVRNGAGELSLDNRRSAAAISTSA